MRMKQEGLHACVCSIRHVVDDRDVTRRSGDQSGAMINMIILLLGAKQPLGQS